MRIPINQIKENLHTTGNEFVEKLSYKFYKGDYYCTGDRYFSGKTFNPNAIEIIKKTSETDKVHSFNDNALNYFFQSSPKLKQELTNQNEYQSIHFTPTQKDIKKGFAMRYFIKKQNVEPILISEVSEGDYNTINSPIYLKAALIWKLGSGFNQSDIDDLDKSSMKGIKNFLSV